MRSSLQLLNADEAKFECTFGRGCEGICCQNGRPSLYAEEQEIIQDNLDKFLPELRPESRALVEKEGFLSKRQRIGLPMLRVVDGWCVFFNKGCVLHKVGGEEGEIYRYKPAQCALFPLGKTEDDEWYVRQHGYRNEKWNLFCLSPTNTNLLAVDSMQDEMKLAEKDDAEVAAAAAK